MKEREAILKELPRAVARGGDRPRPRIEPTSELLWLAGFKNRPESFTGQAAFGSLGQFAAGKRLSHALDGLRDGFTGNPDEGRLFLSAVKETLNSLVERNENIRDWPLLAFANPVTIASLCTTPKFSLTRECSFVRRPRLLKSECTLVEIGAPGSGILLSLPKADSPNVPFASRRSRECRPTLIDYRSDTHISVHSGRYTPDVAEEVGLLGWGTICPTGRVLTDHYQALVLPGDGSSEAADECMTRLPHESMTKSLRLHGDILVEFCPNLDVWLIDPEPTPSGHVYGYLLRWSFSHDGEPRIFQTSHREMHHLLARGTLVESLLKKFVFN